MSHGAPADRTSIITLAVAASLLIVLSVSLYRGREWARRVLVVLVALAALGSTLRAATYFSLEWSGQPDPRIAVSAFVADIGRLILFFVIPAVVATALCHEDVVSSFRGPIDRSKA